MISATLEPRSSEKEQNVEGSRRKVLLVKDSSSQTTPPNSPSHRRQARYRSQPEVTARSKVSGSVNSLLEVTARSKVNGTSTPEFRTVVNVFDERRQQDYTSGVVMDSDSLQSAAAATADNGPRVYTDKLRPTNGFHQSAQTSDYSRPRESREYSDQRRPSACR